jgi:hypothetical protein
MKITKMIGAALTLSLLSMVVSPPTTADRGGGYYGHGGGRGFSPQWHGNIRTFHTYDFPRWRSGYWYHGYYGGQLAWWWVIGGLWYFYPAPVYPYPNPYVPPVVVVQPSAPASAPSGPPPQQYWYYCESARTYYPYVSSCPEDWRAVPANPSSVPNR